MSRGFYNYDTRGASAASQIINLERMVEERDQTIERLRDRREEEDSNIKRLLYKVKYYIERCEESIEGEYGRGRSIFELIEDKAMPALYYEIRAAIGDLEGQGMNDDITLREAAQQALEALQAYGSHAANCDYLVLLTSLPPQRKPCSCGLGANIAALRTALAAPPDDSEALRRENERLREALTYDWDQLQVCRESLREHMAEGKRLQIDADRYRWLKEYALAIDMGADPDNFVQVWVGTKMFQGRTLDDAVDEAMKQAALRKKDKP